MGSIPASFEVQLFITFVYMTLVSAVIFTVISFLFVTLMRNVTIKALFQQITFACYDTMSLFNYSQGSLKNKLLTATSGCSLRSKRTIYFKK